MPFTPVLRRSAPSSDVSALFDTPPSDLDSHVQGRDVPTLYRHVKREQWGLGIVRQMLDDRVHMQFQDGRQRTFKRGYYHFIDAVDRPLDATLGIVEALVSMFPDEESTVRTHGPRPISLAEQVAYFRELFPGGFQNEAYVQTFRGDGRKRPLKRHRDAPIAKAKELLSRAEVARLAEANEHEELFRRACTILKMTSLVPAKERKAFMEIEEAHYESIAQTLRALLTGKSKLAVRFDAFVMALSNALGASPSWELATYFLGLAQPTEHAVVKDSLFELQAVWMAPGLSCSSRPMGLLYERMDEMALKVREGLVEAGLSPRDLFDVREFMWLTLKPKGRRRIMEMRSLEFHERPTLELEPQQDDEAAAA